MLLLCLICKEINNKTSIPYSSLILLTGFILSFLQYNTYLGEPIQAIGKISNEELYYIFIPILIFEAGYNSNLFMFKRNLKSILLLAFPGVLLCTILFALILHILDFNIPFTGLLVISSILGSTDPIAVSALLSELGTPHKLNMLLEGESLLNDGVSLVLFSTFLQFYKNIPITKVQILLNTLTLCVGGPLFGIIIGFIFYFWMRNTSKDGTVLVSITFINCFLVFFCCEFPSWNLSGILALVLSSIVISYKGKVATIEDNLQDFLDQIWKFIKFFAESILFVLTGLFIGFQGQSSFEFINIQQFIKILLKIICFFFLMNLARLLVIFLFFPFMNDSSKKFEYKITYKDCILIAYSGIRGAFPLIICLGIVSDTSYDQYFRLIVSLVTIVTIFLGMIFNGFTIKKLVVILGIQKINLKVEQYKLMIRKEILVKNYRQFQQIKSNQDLQGANWNMVAKLSGLQQDLREVQIKTKQLEQKIGNDSDEIQILSGQEYEMNPTQKILNGNKQINKPFIEKNSDSLIEYRLRIIYGLKALIFQHLKDGHCSAEAAKILLEITECSLEDTEKRLSLWYHLEELLDDDIYLYLIEQTENVPFVHEFLKKSYLTTLTNFYESIYNFIKYLEIIRTDNQYQVPLTENHSLSLKEDIEYNIQQAKKCMQKLTKNKHDLVLLYQTKKASREILYYKKKTALKMHYNGIVDENDLSQMIQEVQTCARKIDNFGNQFNTFYIEDILKSTLLFKMLNQKDIDNMISKDNVVELNPKQYLYRKDEECSGIYVLIDGLIIEKFTYKHDRMQTMGNILGITSIASQPYIYESDTIAESKCKLLKIELSEFQNFMMKYNEFERYFFLTVYYTRINFEENYKEIISKEECNSNLTLDNIYYGQKNTKKELNYGFYMLRGQIEIEYVVEKKKTILRGYHLELNQERHQLKLIFEQDSVLILFIIPQAISFSKGSFIQRQSGMYISEEQVERVYKAMQKKEYFKS